MMATIIENNFTQYQLTEQEQLSGSALGITQKQFIQSQMAIVAELRLALVPEPNNYAAFIQTEAHYKGQMTAYQYLLDASDESEKQLLALTQAQQETS